MVLIVSVKDFSNYFKSFSKTFMDVGVEEDCTTKQNKRPSVPTISIMFLEFQ